MKTVTVLGKGDLAIKVCEWFLESPNYKLVCVVPVTPEPSWTKSLSDWASHNTVDIVSSGHYNDLPSRPDLVVSVFYDKIIRDRFIRSCNNIINIHNSPLPKYRGVSPINWALKNNELEHGITIHEITPGIDDGPIIAQMKYTIYPEFDEVADVYKRALEYGYVLFKNTIPLIDAIQPRKQDEEVSSYYNSSQNASLGDRRYFTKHEKTARTS
jgi:hypothetical protein